MTISLVKNQSISLTKTFNTKKFRIGMGWELAAAPLDLDVMAFVCKNNGTDSVCPDTSHFLFFNNKNILNGALVHSGDNLTGAGDGDDETIYIDFDKLNAVQPDVNEVSIFATVYMAGQRGQNFSQLKEAYLKIYKGDDTELVKYDLDASFGPVASVQIGSFDKDATTGEWNFVAVGVGFNQELGDIARKLGLNL